MENNTQETMGRCKQYNEKKQQGNKQRKFLTIVSR